MALWIDDFNADTSIGEVGFLVRTVNFNRGCAERYSVRLRPAHTNRSGEPRLHGWCGETDNVSVYAEGLAKVVRFTHNGRALLAKVDRPSEIREALETLGYPSLEPSEP